MRYMVFDCVFGRLLSGGHDGREPRSGDRRTRLHRRRSRTVLSAEFDVAGEMFARVGEKAAERGANPADSAFDIERMQAELG